MTCPSLSGSWMSRRRPLLPPKQDHHHHRPTSPLHGLEYSSRSAQNQQFSLIGVNDDLSRPFFVSDLLCFFLQLRLNVLEALPKYPVKQSYSSTATSSTTSSSSAHGHCPCSILAGCVFYAVLTSEFIAIIPGGGDAKPIQHRSFYGFMVRIGPSSSATCIKYSYRTTARAIGRLLER